jgi:hypothetical protein
MEDIGTAGSERRLAKKFQEYLVKSTENARYFHSDT